MVAIKTAVSQLEQGNFDQIIITRSLVNVGKEIGSLPGSLAERSEPYFAHVHEYLKMFLDRKYEKYLKSLDYGNKNIGNEITRFWLDESLKITTYEQIKFLKRLYTNDLPFKIEDMNTLKEIMIDEKNEDYIIRAKTGWEGKYGWYVGYIETKDDVWFFATNIDTKSKDDLAKRKEITLEALKIKGIIK
jgi:beta-lactamase class D